MERPEFVPIDPEADLTPAEVDRHLKRLYNELAFSRLALRDARRLEVTKLRAYTELRIALLLSAECPRPSRSTGVTSADRDVWIIAQVPDAYWEHEGAKVVRQTEEDYSRQVRDQVKCIQSIGANARQAYDLSGRHG